MCTERSAASIMALTVCLSWASSAIAQDVVEAPPPIPVTPESAASDMDLPPMPADDADFTTDNEIFKETTTEGEATRRDARLRGERLTLPDRPLYQRYPRLTLITQVVAGTFGGAVVGLMGGSIGEAIDPGDERLPLGGAHGPLFGGLTGTLVGTAGAVWGTGLFFEKDDGGGYTALGTAVGGLVGAGAAAGFALGMEESDTATTLAISSFLICQIGGAVLFSHLFGDPTIQSAAPAVKSKAAQDEDETQED